MKHANTQSLHVSRLMFFCILMMCMASCSRQVPDPQPEPIDQSKITPTTSAKSEHVNVCSETGELEHTVSEAGMILMGTVGQIRFYGHTRSLLCSEPGAGGVGECEIVNGNLIKVVSPTATTWLKPDVEMLPGYLVYGPSGVWCKAMRNSPPKG